MHTSLTFADMSEKSLCWREKNDCSVKAVAIALDICYAEAWYACRKFGRKYHEGMDMEQILWTIEHKGKETVKLDFQGSLIKLMQYYPKGSYIFEIRNHIMTYKDGVLHDDTGNWIDSPIYAIYHILDRTEQREFTSR